jgi:hypothetical protein
LQGGRSAPSVGKRALLRRISRALVGPTSPIKARVEIFRVAVFDAILLMALLLLNVGVLFFIDWIHPHGSAKTFCTVFEWVCFIVTLGTFLLYVALDWVKIYRRIKLAASATMEVES